MPPERIEGCPAAKKGPAGFSKVVRKFSEGLPPAPGGGASPGVPPYQRGYMCPQTAWLSHSWRVSHGVEDSGNAAATAAGRPGEPHYTAIPGTLSLSIYLIVYTPRRRPACPPPRACVCPCPYPPVCPRVRLCPCPCLGVCPCVCVWAWTCARVRSRSCACVPVRVRVPVRAYVCVCVRPLGIFQDHVFFPGVIFRDSF